MFRLVTGSWAEVWEHSWGRWGLIHTAADRLRMICPWGFHGKKKHSLTHWFVDWCVYWLDNWLIQNGKYNLFHLFYPKIMIWWCSHPLDERSKMDIHGISQGDILMHLRSRILPILLLPTIQSKVFYSRDVQILNKAVTDSLRTKCFIPNPNLKRHHCHQWYFTFVSQYTAWSCESVMIESNIMVSKDHQHSWCLSDVRS